MSPGDVDFAGLGISLILVAVAVVVSRLNRLGLERNMAVAVVRATVQLLGIGAVLAFILDPDRSLALSWGWVVVMVLFAAVVLSRRASEVPDLFPIGLSAFAAAATVTLGVIFGLGIFPLEARALVPLAGMMIGNSMNATVVVARRVVEELRDKRSEVEARLALGQSSRRASLPYIRSALRTALSPQIETTKGVGLVFLPGAMTGLILAGVDPVDAVRVQAAIMFLILGSVATTTAIVSFGTARRLFTPDHRLVPLERPAGT
jgi:putative ABC transport system permease protein